MTVTEFLRTRVPFLGGLSAEDARALALRTEQVPLAPGQLIVLPRGRFAGLYIVAVGAVSVRPCRQAGGHGPDSSLGPGDSFGEASLAAEAASRASYTAAEKGLLFIIRTGALRSLFVRYPSIAARVVPAAGNRHGGLEEFARNFEIRRHIADGGMGSVYEARDRALDRVVAIKRMCQELREKPAGLARFMREARITAALRHPNIVEVYSVVDTDGEALLVLEYVDGPTLAEMIETKGALPPGECLRVVRQAGAALEFAHSRRVIHRDFKPSNVMLDGNGVVKVMDFGVARVSKQTLSHAGGSGIFGTLSYMAPEQHVGLERRASDTYALGVSLYEMLTGVRPFLGPNFLSQKKTLDYVPVGQLVPALGGRFDALIERVLAPEPENRHRSVRDFLDEFEIAMGASS